MSSLIELTNEDIEKSKEWVREFFRVFDSFDCIKWCEQFYKQDTIVYFCNKPPMQGCDEIRTHFQKEQRLLKNMRHQIEHIAVLTDRIYVQNDTTYVVKNDPDKEIKIKSSCVFLMNIGEDKPTSIHVYLDPTPLIEPIQKGTPIHSNTTI